MEEEFKEINPDFVSKIEELKGLIIDTVRKKFFNLKIKLILIKSKSKFF